MYTNKVDDRWMWNYFSSNLWIQYILIILSIMFDFTWSFISGRLLHSYFPLLASYRLVVPCSDIRKCWWWTHLLFETWFLSTERRTGELFFNCVEPWMYRNGCDDLRAINRPLCIKWRWHLNGKIESGPVQTQCLGLVNCSCKSIKIWMLIFQQNLMYTK